MRIHIDAAFTAAGALPAQMHDRVVCIIDVLRASTTITAALSAGAAGVWPAATIEAAGAKKEELIQQGHEVILAGERNAFPPTGFDMGNSPGDFGPSKVAGKHVVLTTTNGTLALVRAVQAGARQIYVACFANLAAVVSRLQQHAARNEAGEGILLLAAGSEGRVSLEDTVCAGMIARGLSLHLPSVSFSDAARVAVQAYAGAGANWQEVLRRGDHARNLVEKGFGPDIDACFRTNYINTIGYWDGEKISAS